MTLKELNLPTEIYNKIITICKLYDIQWMQIINLKVDISGGK